MAPPNAGRFQRVQAKNRKDFNSNEELTRSNTPFNKKLWRQKQYKSKYGNANEGHFLAQKRKIVKEYRKMIHKEGLKVKGTSKTISVEDYDDDTDDTSSTAIPKKTKMTTFTKAKLEYMQKEEDKQKRKEEYARIQKEKEAAIKRYKAKKFARNEKMSKKTKKGQPLMKERMEMLLETLEKQLASERT